MHQGGETLAEKCMPYSNVCRSLDGGRHGYVLLSLALGLEHTAHQSKKDVDKLEEVQSKYE